MSNPNSCRMLTLADAIRRLPGPQGERFVTLFDHGSLVVELYAPHGTDSQTPHSRDEIYVIASGHGEFFCNGERQTIAANDVLFVAAKIEHRFENFSEDFAAWVFFYGPEGGEID